MPESWSLYTVGSYDNFCWKVAKDVLRGDCLVFNIDNKQNNQYDITALESFILGLYTSVGYKDAEGLHIRIPKKVWKIYGMQLKKLGLVAVENNNCLMVTVNDSRLCGLADWLAMPDGTKTIPNEIPDLPEWLLEYYFLGYLAGQGTARDKQWIAYDIEMALTLEQIAIKLYHQLPSLEIVRDVYVGCTDGGKLTDRVISDKLLIPIDSVERVELVKY